MTRRMTFAKWMVAGLVGAAVVGLQAGGVRVAARSGLPPIPAVPAAPSSVSGTVSFEGCAVAPEDVLVRARPLAKPDRLELEASAAGIPTEIGRLPPPNPGGQVVHVRPDSDGALAFEFDDLAPFTPYRIGIKLVGQSRINCERLVWDVAEDPIVVAGAAPIALVGRAVHSRLSMWGAERDGRTRPAWVAADTVDFDDPVAGRRQLRWRSIDPRVNGGRLQVSTQPFPRVGGRAFLPCSENRGAVVFEQDFSVAPGQAATFEVDFHAIISSRTRTDDGAVDGLAAAPGAPTDPVTGAATGVIDANARTMIDLGRPLYVRVLSTVDGAPECNPRAGVPAEVLIAKKLKKLFDQLGEPQFEIRQIFYSQPFISAYPKSGYTCYRVTQDHHIPGFFFATAWDRLVVDNKAGVSYDSTVTSTFPNNLFCVPPADDDDGWFESFVGGFGAVLTGIVDEIAKLVNSASELWEQIQDYAVDAAVAGLKEIGVPCDDTCRAALETGLEVGLATMGVPPSLPNFDQLVDQGADYLAAQVASQVGVPSVLTDYASDEAQKFIKKAVEDMQEKPYSMPKLPDWLVADIHFSPAVLTLHINRRYDHITFPSRPGLIRDNDPIYAGRFVQLPSNLPGPYQPSLVYPMVLDPNTAGLPAAPTSKCSFAEFSKWWAAAGLLFAQSVCSVSDYEAAVWDKDQWVKLRYKNGCYHMRLTGLAPVGDNVFVLRDQYFRTEDIAPCAGK